MTATLALDSVEQAEAVLSGRQRYVRVPMVRCEQGQQGLITADGYDHSWCGRTPAIPLFCTNGWVPDPSWVAAARPCEHPNLRMFESNDPILGDWQCPDCGWDGLNPEGVPRVDVTVACDMHAWNASRPTPAIGFACPRACIDGRVSVGFVRVVGPLLPVRVDFTPFGHPAIVVPSPPMMVRTVRYVPGDGSLSTDISDQIAFLAPDGPDSLIGCWVVAVEVLA